MLLSLSIILIVWSFVDSTEVLAATVEPPQTCRIGVYVASLRNLNLPDKRFSTDFYLWSVCPSKELQPLKSMKVLNVEDFKNFKVANDSSDERKNLSKWFDVQENVYWSGRKVRATLSQSWNVSNFPFDRHTLTIAFEETTKNSSEFVYTTDFDNSGYKPNIDLDSWQITKFKIAEQKISYSTTFGNPEQVAQQESYSRIVISIDIKRIKMFSFFKLTIGVYIAFAVAMLSFFYDSSNTSLASPRRAIYIGALFATLLSMRLQESVLGRTEDLTLIDQIHIGTILYVFGTGVVSVYSRLTSESNNKKFAMWLDRRVFFQLFTISFVVFNVIAIAYAIIVG
ncbi:hypothetical protein APA_1898 [Pseudanabaena sp. lw0831]|nr:hypothetical protein APA_1898 [Pseudanabaena sp. lw0831]